MPTNPKITIVSTEKSGRPRGHYSQAIVYNGLVYVSGTLGIHPGDDEPKAGTIRDQTKQCLANISNILEAAGSDLSKVVKVNIYISNKEAWREINEVYAEVFGEHRPARAVIPCGELYFGFGLEIDAIAAV